MDKLSRSRSETHVYYFGYSSFTQATNFGQAAMDERSQTTAAIPDQSVEAELGTLPRRSSDQSCDGAREDHKFSAPVDEMGVHVPERVPSQQEAEANALETIRDILSTLNFLTSEANRPADTYLSPEDDDIDGVSITDSITDANCEWESNPEGLEERDDDVFLPVEMPSASPGPTTFYYEYALANRIQYPMLSRGEAYDSRAFTPTFVHDCLMLPGALAAATGKQYPKTSFLDRITPALLPGFHAYVHTETQKPCVLQSSDPQDYVQGMVIFGQARAARDRIHEHYRGHTRRVKVQVEVDFLLPAAEPNTWITVRKKIWAHAWLWANVGSVDVHLAGKWTIEDYLANKLGGQTGFRTGEDGFIGGDYEPSESDGEDEGGSEVTAVNRSGESRAEGRSEQGEGDGVSEDEEGGGVSTRAEEDAAFEEAPTDRNGNDMRNMGYDGDGSANHRRIERDVDWWW